MHDQIPIPTAASMTDEEFKATVVKSYNACAAEHARYKRALEQIASGAYADPGQYARVVARRALDDA